MSLQIIIPVIAALAGAGVAGFSGELRHYVQMRRERRKTLNRVLWCQLDLWYEVVNRSNIGDAFDLVFSKLAARLGVPLTTIAPPEAKAKLIEILGETMLPRRDPELDRKYAVAVEELASYEPLLAYKLSGKTDLQRHQQQSKEYVAAFEHQFGTGTEADQIGINALSPFARAEIESTAILVIEDDIKDVSGLLGHKERKAVERLLRKLSDRLEQTHTERIDAAVERVLTWWQSLTGVQPVSSTVNATGAE